MNKAIEEMRSSNVDGCLLLALSYSILDRHHTSFLCSWSHFWSPEASFPEQISVYKIAYLQKPSTIFLTKQQLTPFGNVTC